MKTNRIACAAAAVLAIGITGLTPAAAQAQAASDQWQWTMAVYGWFPGISGQTAFPVPGGAPSFDVSADSLIDALKFAATGTLEGHKGKWGLVTDLVYTDIGGSQNGTRDFTIGQAQIPAAVSANMSLDMKSWIWTFAGLYSVASSPEGTADLVFGGRLIYVDETLNWNLDGDISGLPLTPRSGSTSIDMSNWDAIIGLKGRLNLGSEGKWFIPYYIDIGAGQSQFTWQGVIGLGYQLKWGAVGATWRYLDYELKSGNPIADLKFSGPALGFTYRF